MTDGAYTRRFPAPVTAKGSVQRPSTFGAARVDRGGLLVLGVHGGQPALAQDLKWKIGRLKCGN